MNSIERRARRSGRSGEDGFTLIELMIVMVVIGVLATIAIPNYISALRASKEAVLKEDLHVMRQAIDAYTKDKEKAPQSLDDLVSAGYLKAIPHGPDDPQQHHLGDHDRRFGAEPRPDRLRHQGCA